MQFEEVIGQEELKQKIISAIQKNQLPHAIMLLGQEGSGGLSLARAVAQYVMCKKRTETDSCNVCSNCIKVKKLQHPDLHFSFPYSKIENKQLSNDYYQDFRNFTLENPYASDVDWLESGGNEKQGNITAGECRDILRKLQMRPYESEYKVFIMWYPEYLGNEGNILLKFIEEPTNKTILIFVAENLDEVIMTIQSRSQLYPLKRLSDSDIEKALIERHIPEPKARQLARLSAGNFHMALKLTHGGDEDLLELTKKWLNALYQNKGLDLLAWIEEVTEGSKELQKNFLLYVLQLFEHAIRFKQIGSVNMALLESEQKIIENILGKGLSAYDIEEISELLNPALYQIERNANTKILFHALSLRIQKIFFTQKAPKIA